MFPVLLSGLFIWASLVPILKGAKRESFGEEPCHCHDRRVYWSKCRMTLWA